MKENTNTGRDFVNTQLGDVAVTLVSYAINPKKTKKGSKLFETSSLYAVGKRSKSC